MNKSKLPLIPLSLSILFSAFSLTHAANELTIKTSNLELSLNQKGEVVKAYYPALNLVKEIKGGTQLRNSKVISVKHSRVGSDGYAFTKVLEDEQSKYRTEVTEYFYPTQNSIRWEVTIQSDASTPYWSTPITTTLTYPASKEVTHWLPWADPRGDISKGGTDNALIANAIINSGDLSNFNSWVDPLVDLPLRTTKWHYGAPRYEYDNPGILYCPFQGDVVTIPMISFMEKKADTGLSLVLSVEDVMLDLDIKTTADGQVAFTRYNHRLGDGKKLHFAMDIVAHQADWRTSMDWASKRYEPFFKPVNPLAQRIAGTGAYSNSDVDFDVEKMKKMAFGINWRASFDFPYMGMFIPPVKEGESWTSFVREREQGKVERKPTSVASMQNYCKKMDEDDFHVLSYFNVTEFGTLIEYPRPKSTRSEGQPLWMDANDYLYEKLGDAILFVPDKQVAVTDKGVYSAYPGKPFMTWEKAVALDPGVKSYHDFIVDQAEKTVRLLPNSYGICIDRMDWTRFYNHKTDDGVSWMGDQAVGSLNRSWVTIMDALHNIFHNNNKVIFVNNHVKRIDQLRYVDGIFDEFTYAGSPINTVALMCTHKPALGWMSSDTQLQPDPDQVMQKYLYMGIYPMCPFPGNDHSMRPSALADDVYLDYGTLFRRLDGKEWVLEPHVISVTKGTANVNLFKTFAGYMIPVVFAEGDRVEVTVNHADIAHSGYKAMAYYPGKDSKAVELQTHVVGDKLVIDCTVNRHCAVIELVKQD